MTTNEERLVAALERTDELAVEAMPAVLQCGDPLLHAHIDEQVAANQALIAEVRQ